MAQIIKDSDNTITITLFQADGVTPIDLSTLTGYVVRIFQEPNILFDKFSKNTQTGYRGVNETDIPNGVFEIYLNALNTVNGRVGGEVFYQVKTFASNANFDGSVEEKTGVKVSLGNLGATEMKEDGSG